MILLDTGPIVALLDADDGHHVSCVRALKKIREPLVTAWPVLTEALHLLSFSWKAQENALAMVERGSVALAALDSTDLPRIEQLMRKYRDLPMDLADACLVTLAEREGIETVFTTDRKDFGVYRPHGIGRLAILP